MDLCGESLAAGPANEGCRRTAGHTGTLPNPENSGVSRGGRTDSVSIRARCCIQVVADCYRLDNLPEQKAVGSDTASPRQGKQMLMAPPPSPAPYVDEAGFVKHNTL